MVVSISRINDFIACRRKYYFKHIEKLREFDEPLPLVEGKSYHQKLEQIYKTGTFDTTGDRTDAMAMAYAKYLYPYVKIEKVEKKFEMPLGKHTLRGYIDGVSNSGAVVEHKTTSSKADGNFFYNLFWSNQAYAYLLATETNEIVYTAIQKPTIRQKMNESIEEYIDRCVEWYDVDTDCKIKSESVLFTQDDIDNKKQELISIADEMEREDACLYRNPMHCTNWGRNCEYESICLNYDKEHLPIHLHKIT